ncbi:MAG: hypothetical protein ACLQF0_03330 [Dissulfurispiraceae bacterium]
MSIETAFKALETAMTRCTALQVEMKTVPVEDRGRLMRAYELLDLLEHALLDTAREMKETK